MAKRKKAQPWDAVFDRVWVMYRIGWVYPQLTTDADLDRVEATLGVQLPASYRAFATRFGLGGELMDYLRFDAFVNRHSGDSTVLTMTQWIREDVSSEIGANAYCALERIRQFISFGDDRGGGWFVFDPTERTSIDPLEYRIYWMPKHHYSVECRADTFTDFILWVDGYARELDEMMAEELEDIETRRAKHIRWEPCPIRQKVAPPTPDTALWLGWNNHTARDLALAIRDHGRTDAFPILADALQEAGCTNSDLLDSCRTGEPDIDGKWVLRVLLGES